MIESKIGNLRFSANAPASAHASGGRHLDAIWRGVHAVGLNAPADNSAVSNVRVVFDRVLRAGGWSVAAAVVLLIPGAFISLDSRFKGEGFAALVLMVALMVVWVKPIPLVLGGAHWENAPLMAAPSETAPSETAPPVAVLVRSCATI